MPHPLARGDNIHNHDEDTMEEITDEEPTMTEILERRESDIRIKDAGADDEKVAPLTRSHPLAR